MDTKKIAALAKKVGGSATIEGGRLIVCGGYLESEMLQRGAITGAPTYAGYVWLDAPVNAPDVTEPKDTASLLGLLSLDPNAATWYTWDTPAMPEVEGEQQPCAGLAHALKHHAAAKDPSRPVLCMVLADKGHLVTSDSFRMHVSPVTMPDCLFYPHPALASLDPDTVTVGAEHIAFERDGVRLVVTRPKERYPEWQQIVPVTATPRLRMDVKRGLAALKTARAAMQSLDWHWWCLGLWPSGEMRILHRSDAGQDIHVCDHFGEPLSDGGPVVGLSRAYLTDALAGAMEPTATIGWGKADWPVLIESGGWIAVVMPMQAER